MTSFPLRPFDGHAVTFTLREIHAPSSAEFKSLYHDAEEASGAFLDACAQASSVDLRDPEGKIIAAYAGHRQAA